MCCLATARRLRLQKFVSVIAMIVVKGGKVLQCSFFQPSRLMANVILLHFSTHPHIRPLCFIVHHRLLLLRDGAQQKDILTSLFFYFNFLFDPVECAVSFCTSPSQDESAQFPFSFLTNFSSSDSHCIFLIWPSIH